MSDATFRPRRRLWPVIVAAAAIVVVVAAAWALQSAVSGGSEGSGAAKPYTIVVTRDGAALKTYDLAALHALPQARVVIDGKAQDGPALATLLADAGAGAYTSVDVRGAGLRDRGRLTLTAAQVRRQVQLDFSDRGTVKVCGPHLYHADWVRDVVSVDAR